MFLHIMKCNNYVRASVIIQTDCIPAARHYLLVPYSSKTYTVNGIYIYMYMYIDENRDFIL